MCNVKKRNKLVISRDSRASDYLTNEFKKKKVNIKCWGLRARKEKKWALQTHCKAGSTYSTYCGMGHWVIAMDTQFTKIVSMTRILKIVRGS